MIILEENFMSKQLRVYREGAKTEFDYQILWEEDFTKLADAVKKLELSCGKICIVADDTVGNLYGKEVQKALEELDVTVDLYTFPAGEASKNLDTVKELYAFLIEHHYTRKDVLAALGGGVTGDLTGYAAATYLRGIDFIQIPTTLMAQVDSSVGGKTGVDFRQFKNMVGAFHQPRLVYMNMAPLQSLPEREFGCGMGEILKTGLICDKEFFDFVCANYEVIRTMDPGMLAVMIRRCCAIKAGVVERDPKEQGERALLNLGHTIGHAVEKLMNFQLLHGQCVGIGLVAAAAISKERGLLTQEEYQQVCHALEIYNLPLYVEGLSPQDILAATKKDKKMEQGQIKFILMDGLGKSFIDKTVTDEELLVGIHAICR